MRGQCNFFGPSFVSLSALAAARAACSALEYSATY
jgi:hypothetical protein